MRQVKVALAIAAGLIALAIAATMSSGAGMVVAGRLSGGS